MWNHRGHRFPGGDIPLPIDHVTSVGPIKRLPMMEQQDARSSVDASCAVSSLNNGDSSHHHHGCVTCIFIKLKMGKFFWKGRFIMLMLQFYFIVSDFRTEKYVKKKVTLPYISLY